MLPTDPKARKATPLCTGVLDYFPDALAAVARLSLKANEKHNPGQPLHWSKGKSADHADCLVRHQAERFHVDPETMEIFMVHVAWRALAQLQAHIEAGVPNPGQDVPTERPFSRVVDPSPLPVMAPIIRPHVPPPVEADE